MNDSIFEVIRNSDNLPKRKFLLKLKNCYSGWIDSPKNFINYNSYSYKFNILLKFFFSNVSYDEGINNLTECLEFAISSQNKHEYIIPLIKNGARITDKLLLFLLEKCEVPLFLKILEFFYFPFSQKKIIIQFAKTHKIIEIFFVIKKLDWLVPMEHIESEFYEFL